MERTFNTITFTLFSLKNFQDIRFANSVINIINLFGEDFIPNLFDYNEPLKRTYTADDIQNVVDLWVNEKGNSVAFKNGFAGSHLLMEKKKGHKVAYSIYWKKDNIIRFNTFSMTVDICYFKTNKQLEKFLNLCNEIINLIEPIYGAIKNSSFPGGHEPINLNVRLPKPRWMMIFGKPYVDMFGRDKLLNTPCENIKELSNDIIMLQTTKSLFEPIPEDIINKITNYLGEECFVGQGKDYRRYKDGKTPNFDFSEILFDKSKPIITPQIRKMQK